MLIRSVTAHAFGPLVGEALSFADGMTVVYGANESAKSTWHAAIFAALCGRRRGRAPSAEEKRFAELHKPWDRDDWVVAAQVVLDDGRRLEVRQDLAGRVDCDVRDLDVARDCSAEFLHDGMPDVTRWLGLDRQSFVATAYVAQAQVLTMLERAGGLQEQLQRAAATAGDQTAAAALARIDNFRRDRIGSDRARTKPLRLAEVAVRQAEEELAQARAAHCAYEDRLVEVDRLHAAAARAERQRRLHEAAALTATARSRRVVADEATALHARLGGIEPMTTSADEATAREVAAALAAWEAGHALPAVAPSPAEAERSATLTHDPATAISNEEGVPAEEAVSAEDEVSDEELWDLARLLELPSRPVDPHLNERMLAAQATLAEGERRVALGRRLILGAWVLAILGVAMVAAGPSIATATVLPLAIAGVIAAGCAVTLGLAGARMRRSPDLSSARVAVEVAVRAVADTLRAEQEAQTLRTNAAARLARLGLPHQAGALRAMARARTGSAVVAERDRTWQVELAQIRQRASAAVVAAANRCGIDVGSGDSAVLDPVVADLRRWQADRERRIVEMDEARAAWAHLTSLLASGELADLQRAATLAEDRASAGRTGLLDQDIAAVDGADDTTVDRLRELARAAEKAAGEAEGERRTLAAQLPCVAEAEEQCARAQTRLRRLREVAETLELTRTFLVAAQERAHRTIAPVLVETVRRWLPEVTAGRYTEVMIDPENLRVRVRGSAGRWRDAELLSHGTAEQIYLLLRIALAQHLVRPGTSCPLLLDDVTVHADSQRTEQILQLLQQAATDRQIIFFTQQEQVRDWARSQLVGPAHAVRELAPVATV